MCPCVEQFNDYICKVPIKRTHYCFDFLVHSGTYNLTVGMLIKNQTQEKRAYENKHVD